MLRLVERKHSTTNIALSPILAAGSATSLSILSQGTSATTRVGQQIHVTELEWFGNIGAAAASAGDYARVIVVIDHEPLGANPALTDVLESATF